MNFKPKFFIIALFAISIGLVIADQQGERVTTFASQPASISRLRTQQGTLSIKFHPRIEIPTKEGNYVGTIKTLDLRQRSMTTEHLVTTFFKEQGMEYPSDSVWQEIESINFSHVLLSASNQQLILPEDADKINTLNEFDSEELANIPVEAIEIDLKKSTKPSTIKIHLDYISPKKIAKIEAEQDDYFFALQSIILQPHTKRVSLKLVRVYCPNRNRNRNIPFL